MASALSICSSALLMLGADEITSFAETSREAKLCANLYPVTRDELVQMYPWRFAVGQITLARLATAPLFGYQYAFQLPADLLRIISTEFGTDYRVFENRLYANSDTLRLTYLFRPQEAAMPAYFVRALELRLAEILALALQEDTTKHRLLADRAKEQTIRARAIDAQQQSAVQLDEQNFLLTAVRN